ncbi:hypothetical protein M011DRAFT_507759 [Sporormia fimetaria CBS 119925]|uniref:Uncharacterized protein n=1 Tax=Sporormia fimetaria CBS 119925 TaxID=1340428 RepID=A0A6A6V3T9_9PLEO|nr:hypothetical protein M011DRAFT_507759 [Sporormia fimetaria CBS 119925]
MWPKQESGGRSRASWNGVSAVWKQADAQVALFGEVSDTQVSGVAVVAKRSKRSRLARITEITVLLLLRRLARSAQENDPRRVPRLADCQQSHKLSARAASAAVSVQQKGPEPSDDELETAHIGTDSCGSGTRAPSLRFQIDNGAVAASLHGDAAERDFEQPKTFSKELNFGPRATASYGP